jgi:hypothetical protein
MILCCGVEATSPSLPLTRMLTLMLSVPSSSPQTHMKRPTGRRTNWLTLLLLGPGSKLSNLERMPSISDLIIGGPDGHGSTVGLLLSTGLLLLRFNHQILALPLVMTYDASDRATRRADRWNNLSLG